MGQRFQDAGYDTAYVGKWHLDGHDYFGTGECPPGWDPDYWFEGINYIRELGPEGLKLWRTELKTIEALEKNAIDREFTWAGRATDRAVEFLSKPERRNKPFVLVVSYDEPHAPFTCPPEFAEPFRDYWYDIGPGAFDNLEDKPDHQKEWAETNINRLSITDGHVNHPLYFGCNSFVDDEIGRVLDAMNDQSIENTTVFYTSDHGDMMGAHQLTGKGPVMYDEITRIPLIVCPLDRQNSGAVSNTLASHIDVVPTMLDLAGLERPECLDGKSLVPLLEGGHDDTEKPVFVEFDRFEISNDSLGGFVPIRCIRKGNMKLVVNLLDSDELYDLRADPGECDNLILDSTYASDRNELHDELLNWMYEHRDPFRSPNWERRAWRQSRRLKWWGEFRHVPRDGYNPEVRDYFTGQVVSERT